MRRGFTLIELVFVIVIIGLLAAVALPKFMTVTENAKIKPAAEVANQIVNKAVSRYNLLQDSSIKNAVNSDHDILRYLNELTTNVDKHFNWDVNASEFVIKYDPQKNKIGNYDGSGNQIDTTDEDIKATGNLCIKVERTSIDVPVTVDANVTRYEYNVTEVNYSCIKTP
jgi:prepilin-type N-terminal cleavage/methylation domain-containing protein